MMISQWRHTTIWQEHSLGKSQMYFFFKNKTSTQSSQEQRKNQGFELDGHKQIVVFGTSKILWLPMEQRHTHEAFCEFERKKNDVERYYKDKKAQVFHNLGMTIMLMAYGQITLQT